MSSDAKRAVTFELRGGPLDGMLVQGLPYQQEMRYPLPSTDRPSLRDMMAAATAPSPVARPCRVAVYKRTIHKNRMFETIMEFDREEE